MELELKSAYASIEEFTDAEEQLKEEIKTGQRQLKQIRGLRKAFEKLAPAPAPRKKSRSRRKKVSTATAA